MLETSPLWLGPWQSAPPDRAGLSVHPPAWAIVGPDGGLLGSARWQHADASWVTWLARPAAEVREQPDDSLLLTLVQGWGLGKSWTVHDADGQRVGSVRGPLVRDRFGKPLAERTGPVDGSRLWRTPRGRDLGQLQRAAGGQLVAFAADLPDDSPFIKMLLLASALQELLDAGP